MQPSRPENTRWSILPLNIERRRHHVVHIRVSHRSGSIMHCRALLRGTLFLSFTAALLHPPAQNNDILQGRPYLSGRDAHPSRRVITQQNPYVSLPLPINEISTGYIEAARNQSNDLAKRDALLCSSTAPCADGSCCGTNGKCGYGQTAPCHCAVH